MKVLSQRATHIATLEWASCQHRAAAVVLVMENGECVEV
jgi:hypothetical protein